MRCVGEFFSAGYKSSSACHLIRAGFTVGLFFDPEDGDDMFLRNVS
jgi:hypothetical protein